MRRLIKIDLFHSAEEIREHYSNYEVDDEQERKIQAYFELITTELNKLKIDPRRIKLFVDSVVRGKEEKFLSQRSTTPTITIVRNLISKGAQLIGLEKTEDKLDQYRTNLEFNIAQMDIDENLSGSEGYDQWDNLLRLDANVSTCVRQRDIRIASGIDRKLKIGEVGVMLMGYVHNVEVYLPKDILVEQLSETTNAMSHELHAEFSSDPEEYTAYLVEKRDSFAPQGHGPERI